MTNANDLAKMVPGFEFFQGLMKNAGAGLPNIGQWVAPTLNPEELGKRIDELRTVQFWLEQNARLLGTTIQALEVQRMTLSTLQTMNLPLAELGESLKIRMPVASAKPAAPASSPAAASTAASATGGAAQPSQSGPSSEARKGTPRAKAAAKPAAAPAVDPMQWWGALTQQFAELATKAVRDSSAEAARHLANSAVEKGVATAGAALKQVARKTGVRQRSR